MKRNLESHVAVPTHRVHTGGYVTLSFTQARTPHTAHHPPRRQRSRTPLNWPHTGGMHASKDAVLAPRISSGSEATKNQARTARGAWHRIIASGDAFAELPCRSAGLPSCLSKTLYRGDGGKGKMWHRVEAPYRDQRSAMHLQVTCPRPTLPDLPLRLAMARQVKR